MRIVIPDTSWLWTPDDPILEQFKRSVLFVCLNGKAITDKYECLVSPYETDEKSHVTYGVGDPRLAALASAARRLSGKLGTREDVVFLTDNEPSTLYPYYVLHELQKKDWVSRYKRLHLITLEPWNWSGSEVCQTYFSMLSDMSMLRSVLYCDHEQMKKFRLEYPTAPDVDEATYLWFQEHLITILNGAFKNRNEHTYFDFSTMHYIKVRPGYEKLIHCTAALPTQKIRFPVGQANELLGMVKPPSYPGSNDYMNAEIERLLPRTDGKRICEYLRQQRIALAEANHIPFESKECPSEGPCAGTCAKCDQEAAYLYKQLRKIPRTKRVYPTFDPQHVEPNYAQPRLTGENEPEFLMGDIIPPYFAR